MGLLNRDLFRSFAIGFVVTALGICAVMGSTTGSTSPAAMVPSAQAAPTLSR